MSSMEFKASPPELITNSELRASNRTLALLDQERIKWFFASMSQEVQFEYAFIACWRFPDGARYLLAFRS